VKLQANHEISECDSEITYKLQGGD